MMKTSKLSLALAALVITATAVPTQAKAATYCDEDALENTVIGGVLGGIAGNLLSGGRSSGTAAGAIFGGAVGLGMSCESYPEYYRQRSYALDNEVYSGYHEWDNGRIRVIRSGYYGNLLCREYESYIAVEDEYGEMDEVLVTERACRYGRDWRVVNYAPSSFRWTGNYVGLSINYVPSARYGWGYARWHGGSWRGRHYNRVGHDYWHRRRHVNDHHRWGRRHGRGHGGYGPSFGPGYRPFPGMRGPINPGRGGFDRGGRGGDRGGRGDHGGRGGDRGGRGGDSGRGGRDGGNGHRR
jgi:uncharacterized membrane protein YgcG